MLLAIIVSPLANPLSPISMYKFDNELALRPCHSDMTPSFKLARTLINGTPQLPQQSSVTVNRHPVQQSYQQGWDETNEGPEPMLREPIGLPGLLHNRYRNINKPPHTWAHEQYAQREHHNHGRRKGTAEQKQHRQRIDARSTRSRLTAILRAKTTKNSAASV